MKINPPQINLSSPEVYTSEAILTEWLIAVTTFHQCYHQLIDRELAGHSLATTHVGQCSVSELTKLVIDMQTELEKLVQDINQPVASNQSVSIEGYRKLLSHSWVLDRLSCEVRRALYLTNCAAS